MATLGLQMQNTSSQTLTQNQVITFDTTIINSDSNVTYNSGVITFATTGQYYVSYFLNTATSNNPGQVAMALQSTDTSSGIVTSFDTSNLIKNGQLTGSALLDVPSTGISISIVSITDSIVSLASTTTVNAGITILNMAAGVGTASGSFMIPFATPGSSPDVSTDSTGASLNVSILSFGGNSTMSTLSGGQFTIPAGTDGYVRQFTITNAVTVNSIAATFSNWNSLTPSGANFYPYIQLATAPNTSNVFTMLSGTQVAASTPYSNGATYPAGTITSAYATNLGVLIQANTQVAIMGGWYADAASSASQYIYMNGTVSMSYYG